MVFGSAVNDCCGQQIIVDFSPHDRPQGWTVSSLIRAFCKQCPNNWLDFEPSADGAVVNTPNAIPAAYSPHSATNGGRHPLKRRKLNAELAVEEDAEGNAMTMVSTAEEQLRYAYTWSNVYTSKDIREYSLGDLLIWQDRRRLAIANCSKDVIDQDPHGWHFTIQNSSEFKEVATRYNWSTETIVINMDTQYFTLYGPRPTDQSMKAIEDLRAKTLMMYSRRSLQRGSFAQSIQAIENFSPYLSNGGSLFLYRPSLGLPRMTGKCGD